LIHANPNPNPKPTHGLGLPISANAWLLDWQPGCPLPTRGFWPPARATAGDMSHTWPLKHHAWPIVQARALCPRVARSYRPRTRTRPYVAYGWLRANPLTLTLPTRPTYALTNPNPPLVPRVAHATPHSCARRTYRPHVADRPGALLPRVALGRPRLYEPCVCCAQWRRQLCRIAREASKQKPVKRHLAPSMAGRVSTAAVLGSRDCHPIEAGDRRTRSR
jgi:hypothetical protein